MTTNWWAAFALGSGLAVLAASGGANPPALSTDVSTGPRLEQPDDPYVPPAVPPVYARPGDPGVAAVRGVNGVQVNVDAFGNNITGDAANEPSIAIDPTNPDRIVIGWRQFDTVASNFRQAGHAYSSDGGATWTNTGPFTAGTFRSDPVLAANRQGQVFYYSLQENFLCDMFISGDGGQSWTSPIPANGGDKAWMTTDNSGGVGDGSTYISWSTAAGCCGTRIFTRSTDLGATYMTPRRLPTSPIWGTLAVGPDGALYIAGLSGSQIRCLRSVNAQNGGPLPRFPQNAVVPLGGLIGGFGGPNPGGLVGQVWVAVNPVNSEVYVCASVDPTGADPLDLHFCRSTDNGLTFSDWVRVNDDPDGTNAWQWFGTMSVAPNGRIDVVWNDTRESGATNLCRLYYASSIDGGRTWSANRAVGDPWDSWVGWPNQNKIGDYYHMVSDNEAANLAYAATYNNEQDVYFLRIEP